MEATTTIRLLPFRKDRHSPDLMRRWAIVIPMRGDTVIVDGSLLIIQHKPDGTMLAALEASKTPDAFGRIRQLLSDRRVPDRPNRRVVRGGGRRVTDPTSGFCAFGRRAIAILAEHHPTGYPEPELQLFLSRNQLAVVEVPVSDRPRLSGTTSLTAGRATAAGARVLLAMIVVPLRARVAGRL